MINKPSEGREGTFLDASGDESGVVVGRHGERVLKRVVPVRWDRSDAGPSRLPESAIKIARECDRIKAFLLEKNLTYGDSAGDPMRLFSNASPTEALLVRIDDKLSRVARGSGEYPGDDTVLDLIGYLILLRLTRDTPSQGVDFSQNTNHSSS